MSYLTKWVSEVMKEGHTITAADVEVLARVQQCILAADKHHQQARDAQRDAQANVAEKLVVNAAVALADSLDHYESHSTTDFNDVRRGRRVNDNLENLRVAVAHLLAVEAAS